MKPAARNIFRCSCRRLFCKQKQGSLPSDYGKSLLRGGGGRGGGGARGVGGGRGGGVEGGGGRAGGGAGAGPPGRGPPGGGFQSPRRAMGGLLWLAGGFFVFKSVKPFGLSLHG